jgi:hypothetical protein
MKKEFLMPEITKASSPFYPGHPVPIELFTGRAKQIERIITRGVGQVAAGKPVSIFVQGEYGIGKSSIARYVQWVAEKEYGLHGIYAPLGGANNLNEVASSVLEGAVRSGATELRNSEKFRNFIARWVGKQELFGITINAEALKKDAPNFSTPFGMLDFLTNIYQERLQEAGVKGIFLVLDEINGITQHPQFAHFIKGLVDSNVSPNSRLPLLLMLCGVEERRREMIQQHQPIDRIFDIVDIEPMTNNETEAFFQRAFSSVHFSVEPSALETMVHFSAGFPKIMHLIGDAAYWVDKDGIIDADDAASAVIAAADEVGKKYVDQQVYEALKSNDYRSILRKIAKIGLDSMSFFKKDVEADLTDREKGKFNNFLQKMKKLKVLRSGEVKGEYVFTMRMTRFYIWMRERP